MPGARLLSHPRRRERPADDDREPGGTEVSNPSRAD